MTDPYADCTEACEAAPDCAVCRKRKGPAGRSVPMETANGYCDWDCPGYREEPGAGHLWPGELRRHREELEEAKREAEEQP